MHLPRANTTRLSLAAILAAVLLGALGGSGAYTFSYAEGLSYLSNDPSACVNCHVMREQHDGWQKASHHAHATCNDCHVPQDPFGKYTTKALHGWRHSKAFTLNDFSEPIRILPEDLDIVHDNCVRCHTAIVSELASPPHASATNERIDCTRCHASVAHGPRR